MDSCSTLANDEVKNEAWDESRMTVVNGGERIAINVVMDASHVCRVVPPRLG